MSFNAANYKAMYAKFLGPLAQPVTLRLNNGTGWDDTPSFAHVSAYRESDLVPGGSIELGDLRLIISAEDLPDGIRRLERKDRITIEGRDYGVIHWDSNTRSVGAEVIAVEAAVRG